MTKPAIVGFGIESSSTIQPKPAMTTFAATAQAAKQAFSLAATKQVDVNVAEVHHFFTGVSSISYEGRGFAEWFRASRLLEAEETTIGGGSAVNTSGKVKAQGQPPMISAARSGHPQPPIWEGLLVHG
jgi:acetyl-CoA C-acetyltransferase